MVERKTIQISSLAGLERRGLLIVSLFEAGFYDIPNKYYGSNKPRWINKIYPALKIKLYL